MTRLFSIVQSRESEVHCRDSNTIKDREKEYIICMFVTCSKYSDKK